MGEYEAKLVMAGIVLGIAALAKIARLLTDGVTGKAKMNAAIKRLKAEAAEKERLALAAKAEEEQNEEEAAVEEEENVTEDEVEVETAVVTEENQQETMAMEEAQMPEEDEALEEAVMEEGNWKCPQCGRINPAYLYACICGNRFR